MNCQKTVEYRYTLEGDKEKYACLEHAMQIKSIAELMGYQLKLILVNSPEKKPLFCDGASK